VSARRASVDEVADVLFRGEVVAFTGAGISAEAGIPTFRDPGGVWERFDPDLFGTWEGLGRAAMERPDDLAAFLAELRRVFAAATPTPAHLALARLEEAGVVEGVITQNVDGLHQEAGSRRVIEVHGSFSRVSCLVCGNRERVDRRAFVEHLDRAIVGLRSAFVASLTSLLPRCSRCAAPARPDFVAFGERLQDFPQAEALAEGCRVLLVVGTSGEVYPAATLPETAAGQGAVVVEVGPEPASPRAELRMRERAGAVLPRLADAVLARRARE
jgi:NAD-dependent deacetylase